MRSVSHRSARGGPVINRLHLGGGGAICVCYLSKPDSVHQIQGKNSLAIKSQKQGGVAIYCGEK